MFWEDLPTWHLQFLDDGVQVERIVNEVLFPVRLVEYPHLDEMGRLVDYKSLSH
jgi:hypothetical protein